jgi:hypothetical protein
MENGNLWQARYDAQKWANKTGEAYNIIYEDGEYHAASDYDCDTFWMGAAVIQTIYPQTTIAT